MASFLLFIDVEQIQSSGEEGGCAKDDFQRQQHGLPPGSNCFDAVICGLAVHGRAVDEGVQHVMGGFTHGDAQRGIAPEGFRGQGGIDV